MIEYPKIETLYDRDEKFKVIPGVLRRPEFALPRRWVVTEKIDGTNIRVGMTADGAVSFAGRTDKAQIPVHLLAYLVATFTRDRMAAAFTPETEVVLFGESYGAKIQNGGDYRPDVGFALFDACSCCDHCGMPIGGGYTVVHRDGCEARVHIYTADCLAALKGRIAELEMDPPSHQVVAVRRVTVETTDGTELVFLGTDKTKGEIVANSLLPDMSLITWSVAFSGLATAEQRRRDPNDRAAELEAEIEMLKVENGLLRDEIAAHPFMTRITSGSAAGVTWPDTIGGDLDRMLAETWDNEPDAEYDRL